MTKPNRPIPVADVQSEEFWLATAAHSFVLARCEDCARLCHPPTSVCPNCGSADPNFTFAPAADAGIIRSWTVMHQSFLPGFDVPYVLVDCELAAQADLRLIGRLLDGPDARLRIGAPVRATFEDVARNVSVLAFELTRHA